MDTSSVDCGARGQRNFRFALRCPDGAISGQKRVFLGCFWGFLAPRQAGRPGEPRSDQSEAEFGAGLAFTYTHNREMGGGPLLVKKGGLWAVLGGVFGTSGCRTSSTSHGKPPNIDPNPILILILALFSILIRS